MTQNIMASPRSERFLHAFNQVMGSSRATSVQRSELPYKVFHNGVIAVRYCPAMHWMLATRDGWWPVDQVDQDTMNFLESFAEDERLPFEFRHAVVKLNATELDRDMRAETYKNVPILHGARIDLQ